jgi:hypothetical protein
MAREDLIWEKDFLGLVIWGEWEDKEGHLNFRLIWEEMGELILIKYLECFSSKMVEWEVLILASVGLAVVEKLAILEEWEHMDLREMRNLMILGDLAVLAIWVDLVIWEDLEILVANLEVILEANSVILVQILERLIKEDQVAQIQIPIRNDRIYLNLINYIYKYSEIISNILIKSKK